jgi:xylan 1,4-beta-xylosidase
VVKFFVSKIRIPKLSPNNCWNSGQASDFGYKSIAMKYLLALLVTISFSAKSQSVHDNQIYLADPTIYFYNKYYYLYGTVEGDANRGFKVYRSKDQTSWKEIGYALKKGDSFGDKSFWAPQVFKLNKQFYIAYVANEHIAIAKSGSPAGPFKQDILKPLDAPVKQIDPYIFKDYDGRIYLYYVRLQAGNRIFVAEMKPDLSAVIPETVKECITATESWENTAHADWPVAEGPTVIKRNDLYYLFYSANDFRNPDYAVGYATSKWPTGPWTKYENNPILSRRDVDVSGTGHGDLFTDQKGQLYYVFHTHHSDRQVAKRRTALLKIDFRQTPNQVDEVIPDFKSFHFIKSE